MVGEEQLEVEDEVEETHATPKKIFQILNQVKKLIRNCAFIEKKVLFFWIGILLCSWD